MLFTTSTLVNSSGISYIYQINFTIIFSKGGGTVFGPPPHETRLLFLIIPNKRELDENNPF